MLRRVLLAALAAGLLAGAVVTAAQSVTTTPLILAAEAYEHAGEPAEPAEPAHAHGPAATLPGGGLDRLAMTASANLVTGVGFALLIAAGFALSGRPVDGRRGLLWGLAGFGVFALAPALGLPPELPGTHAADLADRQAWWIFAAVAAGIGLALVAWGRNPFLRLSGVPVAALPHVLGAPEAAILGGSAPPELAAQFAVTALAVNALFWAVLGWSAGAVWRRLA